MAMTRAQMKHVERIRRDFSREVGLKYARGAKARGGSLLALNPLKLVEEAVAETLDQYVYLHTLREALREQRNRAAGDGHGQRPARALNEPRVKKGVNGHA